MSPSFGITELFAASAVQSVFPLSLPDANIRDTYNGSAALYQYALIQNLSPDHTIALPAYMCGSEVGPFDYLGCKFVTYNVRENLQVDYDDLARCLEQNKVHTVLVTHYFGIAQDQIEDIAELCNEHSTILLEDCAHALYSSINGKALGSFGDYSIFSQRKFLSITEGGMLVSNQHPLTLDSTNDKRAPFVPLLDRTLNAILIKQRTSTERGLKSLLDKTTLIALLPVSLFVKTIRTIGQKLLPTWVSPEMEGPDAIPVYNVRMSTTMLRMFNSANAESVRRRRQENYRNIATALSTTAKLKQLLPEIDAQCCPLYFPIVVSDPAALVNHLDTEGIEAYKWWQHNHDKINLERFSHIKSLKQSVVALPCHQDIEKEQLDRMTDIIASFYA